MRATLLVSLKRCRIRLFPTPCATTSASDPFTGLRASTRQRCSVACQKADPAWA